MEQKMMGVVSDMLGLRCLPVEYPGKIFLLSVISSDDLQGLE